MHDTLDGLVSNDAVRALYELSDGRRSALEGPVHVHGRYVGVRTPGHAAVALRLASGWLAKGLYHVEIISKE